MCRRAAVLTLVLCAACGDDGPSGPPDVYFDLASSHDTYATFWDQPFP
jgi:hypothetical protein